MPDTSDSPSGATPTPARSARRPHNKSLMGQILIWMFGPLFLLWTIGIVITYFIAQNIANAPYDRTLTDHLRALKHEIEQSRIDAGFALSPTLLTVFRGEDEQPTRWEIRDANGRSLAGSAHIPLPDNWAYEKDKIRFLNDSLDGQSIRIAYTWGGQDANGTPFLTVVAQTNERRAILQQEILTGMLTPQLIVLPLAALLAGLGLTQGLEPLTLLQERIRARRPNDLSPIEQDLAPTEITPLLTAMNDLLHRLASSTQAQRRFVANAAHQLKTPLAGMRTQAELALREHSPEKLDASLKQLVRGSQRATRLVNQLLALTRAESVDNPARHAGERIDLNALAQAQTSRWVEQAMLKSIDLGFEPAPGPVWIAADSMMLDEMLGNLIDNALLYTPENGWATVRVGHSPSPWIEVEDSGSGIPAEYREQIFDRFFRILGTSVDGSGLGLAIVKEIAEQHGASIAFVAPGERNGQPGTTCLRVSFPA